MSIKVLVVDSDADACGAVGRMLQRAPDVDLVGQCSSGPAAARTMVAERPDLVLMGVRGGRPIGLREIAAVANGHLPRLVFMVERSSTTARDVAAAGIPHLVTPVRERALLETVAEVTSGERRLQRDDADSLNELLRAFGLSSPPLTCLVLRHKGRIDIVRTLDVDWIEAAANYVRIHVGQETHRMRCTISNLEKRLEPDHFLRIHRSIIVNVDRMRQIRPWFHGSWVVVLHDGTRLNLSRSYRPRVEAFLAGLAGFEATG